jgi:hypothetical protein
MLKLLSSILLVLFLATSTFAFDIVLKNSLDKTQNYWIFWVDHNWEGQGYDPDRPAPIAGGGLDAGKDRKIEFDFPGGTYLFIWTVSDSMLPAQWMKIIIAANDVLEINLVQGTFFPKDIIKKYKKVEKSDGNTISDSR